MPDTSPVTPEEENAIQYVKGIKEFYSHLFMYALFATVFGLTLGIKHPFIFWGALGWGIGVLVHGLNAFEVIDLFGPNWERRQIEKRLGRPL